ncbi:MAG TPA: TraR/DksA C4-type zinc finger protein [Gemmatimonadaceae bacterium]
MSLTPHQRRVVERRLQEERERALRTLNRTVAESAGDTEQDRSGDLTSVPFHPADLGTDTMQAELDASNVTRTSREFAEIEAALERLYARPDRFGICEDTGQQIPFERLEVIPWARTCLEAER